MTGGMCHIFVYRLIFITLIIFQLFPIRVNNIAFLIGTEERVYPEDVTLAVAGNFGNPNKARPGIPAYLQFRNDVQLPLVLS
jgi:hypothetical protein